jgi:hypothetical protein
VLQQHQMYRISGPCTHYAPLYFPSVPAIATCNLSLYWNRSMNLLHHSGLHRPPPGVPPIQSIPTLVRCLGCWFPKHCVPPVRKWQAIGVNCHPYSPQALLHLDLPDDQSPSSGPFL